MGDDKRGVGSGGKIVEMGADPSGENSLWLQWDKKYGQYYDIKAANFFLKFVALGIQIPGKKCNNYLQLS